MPQRAVSRRATAGYVLSDSKKRVCSSREVLPQAKRAYLEHGSVGALAPVLRQLRPALAHGLVLEVCSEVV